MEDDVLVIDEEVCFDEEKEDLRCVLERRRRDKDKLGRKLRTRVCYKCRKPGHLAATCVDAVRVRSVIVSREYGKVGGSMERILVRVFPASSAVEGVFVYNKNAKFLFLLYSLSKREKGCLKGLIL